MDYKNNNRRPMTIEERKARNQRKNKLRKRNQIIKLSIGLFVFIIFLTIFIVQRKTIAALNNSYKQQVDSQKRLKERVEGLQGEIKEINTLEYIEKRAREDLGMIKEDEKIYVNDKDKDSEINDSESKDPSDNDKSQQGEKDQQNQNNPSGQNAASEDGNQGSDQEKKPTDDGKKDNKKNTKKKKSSKKKKSTKKQGSTTNSNTSNNKKKSQQSTGNKSSNN